MKSKCPNDLVIRIGFYFEMLGLPKRRNKHGREFIIN